MWSASPAEAGGTWTSLATAPPTGVNNCLLLSDGTVLTMDGGADVNKLTPDIHGSYINGTWTRLTSMNSSRLFFASDVLTNGNVYVAGGEYGDANHYDAELYDARANTWTVVPGSQNFGYSDSPSEMLPNGELLVSDSQSTYNFYNTASNLMIHGGPCGDMNEVCWAKLANGCIFGVDNYGGSATHYVPSLNEWVADTSSPPPGFQGGDDQCFLLPNGQVFHLGSQTPTGFYTPGATVTSAGTLVTGPNLPMDDTGTNALFGGESPGAMLVTGNILLDLAPGGGGASGGSPCYFYEYNYLSNTFTQVSAPGGGSTYGASPFVNSMLDLPDGSVLFVGGQNSGSLYIYTPSGTPLAAGQPVINSITENLDGSYHLSGVGLNGISEGAMFGDDEQMACNYPLVRLTNSVTGNIYYARTYGWNSTTVQNPNVVTTEFALPPNLPAGTYSLVVTAVGNASAAQSFVYAPPPVPTGLTAASGSNGFVNLQWSASAGATAYDVKRAATSSGYFATIATISGTNYTDAGLTNGLVYYYKVAAVGSSGPSSDSGAVSATPFGPPPVPTGLTAIGSEDAMVPLTWNPSYGATNYNVKRSANSSGPYMTIASLNGTHFTDTTVVNSTTYYYVVTSVGPEGESGNSTPAAATPLAPVIATWFKADALTGLGSGSALATWLDSSGHGYNASQGTAGQRPTYVTAAINGLPVVRFNSAASSFLSFSRSVQSDFMLFIVFQSTQNSQGTGTAFYQGAGLVNGDQPGVANDFGTALNANGQVMAGTGNPDSSINSGNGFNDGRPHLVAFKRMQSTGAITLDLDGTQVAAGIGGVNSLTAPPTLDLGAVPSGGGYFSGDLGEVKIYTSALDDADRLAQEAALIHKWGVSLPGAPSGLTAAAANGQVQLTWVSYPTATNYLVMRSLASGGPYSIIGSTTATNYIDGTVANGTTYYYVVSAVTPYVTSSNSSAVSATPQAPATVAWLRADDITGLGSGSALTTWLDSSGRGYNASQGTVSQKPTFVTGAMNGLPVVRFNSAKSAFLSMGRPVQDDFTMFIVFQSSQNNQGTGTAFYQGAGLVNGDQSGVANDFGTALNANGQILAGTGNPDTSVNSANGFNNGQPHVVTFKRTESTGTIALFVDGTPVAAVNGGTNSLTAPPTLDLGAVPSGGGFFSGDLAEVKMFNTALSDVNREVEENNLECKYSIGSTAAIPGTPGALSGIGGGQQVALSWIGVSGATGYTPLSATNPSGPFAPLETSTATSYLDTNAVVGQTNYYEVAAVNGCNPSSASAPIAVFLPLPILNVFTPDGVTLTLTWPVWANSWNISTASNLNPPVVWSPVTNAAVNTNNELILTLPINAGAGFYRLGLP